MISAGEIASRLGAHEPTAEQTAIIEAPPEGTYRVIAGAGSGKTETMAQRVLWLVANGHVAPDEILGLTFTRKAAGELGHRIAARLDQLHAAGVAAPGDEFQRPLASTYNAFASSVYRDHAVLLGMDPDAQVLSEASAWSLANHIVRSSSHEALADWDYSASELTRVLRVFAQRMADNRVDRDTLLGFVEEFRSLGQLPAGGRGNYPEVTGWIDNVAMLEVISELATEYTLAKRARGVIEFSDQVSLALTALEAHPEIAHEYRSRHRVVLLDEYQDTSVAQTRLLRALFSNHPVMAVGDPHQAIYGWRGASSANLDDFARSFGDQVTTFSLTTSWRNGTQVLAAANRVAEALRETSPVDVGALLPSPTASAHAIDARFEQTLAEEAAATASWFVEILASDPSDPPSAALLLRARTHQRVFVEALREAGVPVHVLGIGGLLDDPAVADTVCALRVIADPSAESELVRLLSGAKWRIGVADLYRLFEVSRWLRGRDEHGVILPDALREALHASVSRHDQAGLWDALAFIVATPPDHSQREGFSELALERLADAHQTLQRLASMHVVELDELHHQIEQALGLDIEIAAHPQGSRYQAARETLIEALATYQRFAEDPSPRGFVRWLDEAERRDNLSPRQEPPEPGCVQVLTIHGAKGLEWDAVAISRLVEDEMPQRSRESSGWLARGELPYPLRGDRESLPTLRFAEATSRKELRDLVNEFKDEVRDHRAREERRLMYVAVTRARHRLLLTGSFWAHHQKHRAPSPWLEEIAQIGLVSALPHQPEQLTPPEQSDSTARVWPGDPLGSRREALEKSAEAIRAQMREATVSPGRAVLEALAGLTASSSEGPRRSMTPRMRVSASALAAMAADPDGYLSGVARPVPGPPHRAALRGTLFHQYLERTLQAPAPVPFVDIDQFSGDIDDPELSIEDWIEAFEASEFAGRSPSAIEAEIHLPLADFILVCKMDAVFDTDTGVHIVDWKTGKEPSSEQELTHKSLQLAAYRLAWSAWAGIDIDRVEASFWFAQSKRLVTPKQWAGADELERVIRRAQPTTERQTPA